MLEVYNPSPQSPKGFSDVAGMSDLKRDLSEGIIQLIQNPEQAKLDFDDYGKTIPKSILLYGPPGCGKTYITQALAAETESPLYLLNISKAGSHYINMTSKNIQAAFDEMISIADKSDKPCLLFMDEIDTMAAAQKYLEGGISKTINLKPNHTIQDVDLIIRACAKQGIKGISVFPPQ